MAKELSSRLDTDKFINELASYLKLPPGTLYETARGIQAWILAHQGKTECGECGVTSCIGCAHRRCLKAIELHPSSYFQSNENTLLTAEEMRSTFCDICIQWQMRAHWKKLDKVKYFERRRSEGQEDADNFAGDWEYIGKCEATIKKDWKTDCVACSAGLDRNLRFFCPVCHPTKNIIQCYEGHRDSCSIVVCKHGTCECSMERPKAV
jgi:hypothetical protein